MPDNSLKAVFIDRDGTINKEKGYVHAVADFELIPGALEALHMLTRNNISINIVTNQAGIAKGYYTEEQFLTLTKCMIEIFDKEDIRIENVLYCPHHPDGVIPQYTKKCACRKPGAELIERVMSEQRLACNQAALIGDKNSDIEAGIAAGISTYLVLTGYGREHQAFTRTMFVVPDILGAVRHLLHGRSC